MNANPAPARRFPEEPGAPAPIPVDGGSLWVFGYGSLMWNPGFAFEECCTARLYGFHRQLCVWSTRYRGTPSQPGLVVGLDRGGSCVGMAFHVAAPAVPAAIDYLRGRELITGIYRPRFTPARLVDGRCVRALAFVVRRHHPQYAGRLDVDSAARIVRRSAGHSGANADYVTNTVDHLRQLGLHDAHLAGVAERLRGAPEIGGEPDADSDGPRV